MGLSCDCETVRMDGQWLWDHVIKFKICQMAAAALGHGAWGEVCLLCLFLVCQCNVMNHSAVSATLLYGTALFHLCRLYTLLCT